MSDQRFESIKNFVQCLWKAFGNKTNEKALAMYVRLFDKIDLSKDNEKNKIIEPFTMFFINHLPIIKKDLNSLPRGTRINFGTCENIFVDIQRFIHKSEPEEIEIIRSHLLLINAAITPTDDNINDADEGFLGCIDQSSPEGRYLYSKFKAIMSKIRKLIQEKEGQEVSVESVMLFLASSGELKKFFSGVEHKNLDPNIMKTVVANTINSMMSRADEDQINIVKQNFQTVPGFDNIKAKLKETGVKLFD